MLNLTTAKLSKMLTESDKRIGDLNSELSFIASKIRRLNDSNETVEGSLKSENKKHIAIREALIINKGIPQNVSDVRNVLLTKIELSKTEDITIAQKRELDAEIEALKIELPKICSHQFLYYRQGYVGSPSQDRENGYPDHRYCIVCGFSEDGKSNRQYDFVGTHFVVLIEADGRIIKNEPWTSEGIKRVNIWIPLGAVLKPFEESVVRTLNS